VLLSFAAAVPAGEPIRPEEWVFHDGRNRTLADLQPNLVVAVHFIADDHWYGNEDFLRQEVKALHDRIEARRLPIRLVCIAPDLIPNQLVGWARDKGVLTGALTAWDPLNRQNITKTHDLEVILLHPNGRSESFSYVDYGKSFVSKVEAAAQGSARHRFVMPKELVDDRALQVWWTVERGVPDAIPTARRLARTAPAEVKPQLQLLVASLSASFAARTEEALAKPYGLAAAEACEQVLIDYPGMEKAEQKPLLDRIKTIQSEPMYAPEFAARTLWFKALALRKDPLASRQQQAKTLFNELRVKHGQTVYGKRAGDL
jgi:hypothetical protein